METYKYTKADFGGSMPNSRRLHADVALAVWGKDIDGITTHADSGEILVSFKANLADKRDLDTLVVAHDKTPDL